MDGKIDEETKGRRLSELIAFQTEIVREEKKKRVGSVAEVLVGQVSKQDQGMMLCHSEHNEMVVVPTRAPVGTLLTVRLSGLKGNTFTGEEVQNG
jgi:tRNA A37 methylthiotransferase MiaB